MKVVINILCITLFVSAQSCVSNEQFYDIFASENETQEWDLNTQFFTGENLKFKIAQEINFFQVLNPLHQIGQTTNVQTLKILSLKPQKQNENGVWTNTFVALGFNETYFQILYSKDGILNQNKLTNFNETIKIREKTNGFSCFDFDFISETKVVVDCNLLDSENPNNYINGLLIVDIQDKNYFGIELIDNPLGYNYTEYRIVQFHKYIFENLKYQNLYFRSEPAWETEKARQTLFLKEDSILEVFEFTKIFTLQQRTPITVLTKSILAKLLGIDESVLHFSLVDFKIDTNGQINILDSNKGLYVLSLNLPNLEWKLDEWIINPFKTACLGFDINHSIQKDGTITKKLILVFNDKLILFENGVIQYEIRIPQIEQYNSNQIQLSQKYIILRIKTMIHIYSINNGKQIFISQENLDKIIVNPNYEDIVGINSQIAKRFFLNNGLLQLNRADTSSSRTNIITLTAETIEQPVKKCSVTINLYILKKNESQIYTFNNSPFKTFITIPSNSLYLDQIASGPNLQYTSMKQIDKDLKQSYISYQIQSLMNFSIENIHMPDPKQIVYSDLVLNENQKEFYLLHQVTSKIVYIYRCQNLNQNMEQLSCDNYNTFGLPSILDKSVGFFYWFIQSSTLILIHQSSQFSIYVYSAQEGSLKNILQILFNDSVIENQISSVALISDNIYIVQSGLKRISIYQLQYPFSLLQIVDQTYIQKFDISGLFTPIKVFGNKNNNLVFIQTQTSLLIGTFSEIYTPCLIIHKEVSILTGSEMEIVVGINSFFILQILKDQQQIEEYNSQNLQNIFKLRDVPLYNYKLQKPLTVDYSFQTGWLYVRASDGQQTVILIYQPNVLSHVSLNKVIDTKGLVKDGQIFNFAVDGIDQMILYYNNITNHQFLSIYTKPTLYLTPKPDQIEYVYNQVIAIQVSGITGVKPITSQSQITILNTQSQLFIQQALFDSKKKIFQFIKQSQIQFISMGTDWYSGQVIEFNIKCQKCISETQIISNIFKIKDSDYFGSPILDGQSFGQAGQVYQTKNALIFQDLNNRFKNKILINLDQEECYQISISADQNFILSAWQNIINNQFGLYIHKCKFQDLCSPFRQGIYTLKSFQKIAKIYMPDSKNIIILNTNHQDFSAFINFIVVASFDDDGTQFSITHQYVINNQYVGTNQLFIADFDFIKYQINGASFATILFTDINNGIYFAHFKYNDQGLLTKTTNELFKLINFQDDQFFIDSETKFYQVKVILFQINKKLLSLNVLVTTNNQAQYIIAFDLNSQNPQFGLPIIKSSTSLINILTPYGNWPSINKLAFFKDFVAIPYTNQKKVVIGIYSIPNFRESTAKIISFTHSLSSYYNNISPEEFVMIFNKDNETNYPSIFINIYYDNRYDQFPIEQFQIRSDPQILLRNSTSYENELQIQICLKNDFNQICGNATLTSINKTKISNPILDEKFLE